MGGSGEGERAPHRAADEIDAQFMASPRQAMDIDAPVVQVPVLLELHVPQSTEHSVGRVRSCQKPKFVCCARVWLSQGLW